MSTLQPREGETDFREGEVGFIIENNGKKFIEFSSLFDPEKGSIEIESGVSV